MLEDLSVLSYDDDTRVITGDGDFRVTVYDDDVKVRLEGSIGINGQDGAGVTPGGLEGWLLAKATGVDFDTAWVPPQVPLGGVADQVLTKIGPNPFDSEWRNPAPSLPDGGATGAVLAKFSDNPYDTVWATLPNPDLRVAKTGDTMTGPLVLPVDPVNPLEATTKQYTDTKAPLTSPVFDGTPMAPTPAAADNSDRIATTAFFQSEMSVVTGNFIAKIGDTMGGPLTLAGDPVSALQATTKQYADTKAPITSPVFDGTPMAPTPAGTDNTDRVATTAFVQNEFGLQLPFYLSKSGGVMTGAITLPGNPGSALQAAPKQYVDAQVIAPYQLQLDTILRSNQTRWNDHLNIAEVATIDPTGSSPNFHIAMNLAWSKALARNLRSVIEIPQGNFKLGAVPEFLNNVSLGYQAIEFRGAGMQGTSITGADGVHDSIRVGSHAAANTTGNVIFSNMQLSPGATPTGAVVALRKGYNIIFDRVKFHQVFRGVSIEDGAVIPNLSNNVFLIDCEGTCAGNGIMLYPRSVQVLVQLGGKWGGGPGRKFFVHDSLDFNCDGVYLIGGYFEDFEISIDSIGRGLVNVEIQAKQFDATTASPFIRMQPTVGTPGSNRNWVIHDTQFQGLGAVDDAVLIDGTPGVDVCEAITISACNHHNLRKRAYNLQFGSGVILGGVLRTCGKTGTEIIRMGANANFELGFLQGHRGGFDTTAGFPTHGIIYDGPSTGKRGHTACRFWDATVAPFSGTP